MKKKTPGRKKAEKLSPNELNLIRRYLIWCYKTTKEELDRIDRYFTQAKVDEVVLDHLKCEGGRDNFSNQEEFLKEVEDFKTYMKNKQERAFSQKYAPDQSLQPHYCYLKARLEGLEEAIVSFLGKGQLRVVQDLYEQEMTRRIMEAREHT